MSSPADPCPGCGLIADEGTDPAPPEFHASSGCWRRYGELLARSYGAQEYRSVHQLVVDSYVAQHPTGATRRSVQQVALCLMTLDLFLEQGYDVSRGPELHQRMMANLPELHALDPPDTSTELTVEQVLRAQDVAAHQHLVRAWAQQVWSRWRVHQRTIRRWNDEALGG
jgi:hypothetical protein